jgi:hypothetical protein
MRRASRGDSVIGAAVQAACRPSRFRPALLRYVALIAAMATTVACVITAPASASTQAAATPAAAASASTRAAATRAAMALASARKTIAAEPMDSSESELCLTNADSYCMTVDPVGLAGLIVATANFIFDIWIQVRKGTYQGKHEKYAQIELQDNQNGLCLADTFGDAYLASCGANGTIWLVIPHSDGAYLESRYTVDNGIPEVLTVDPLYSGSELYVYAPEQPGSAYWQTWSGFPSLPTA